MVHVLLYGYMFQLKMPAYEILLAFVQLFHIGNSNLYFLFGSVQLIYIFNIKLLKLHSDFRHV